MGTMDKVNSKAEGPIDGEGSIDCTPAWGSAAAPPQGIIADGDDGSHWCLLMTRDMATALVPSGLRLVTLVLATVTGLSHWTMANRQGNSAGTLPALVTSTSTAPCSLDAMANNLFTDYL